MKVSKRQLRRIIREEKSKIMLESKMKITRRQIRRLISEMMPDETPAVSTHGYGPETQDAVLRLIRDNPGITADEIAAQVGLEQIDPPYDMGYQVLLDLEDGFHAIHRDPDTDGYHGGSKYYIGRG